jgi:hypothetical protein
MRAIVRATVFGRDQADPWEPLLLLMPALAAAWIAVALCWSARIVGLL